ncbi:hypothetical protein RchiOBHm_Chr2g0146731 [Rosa chinensis]|uniref:Myb/SANT-like DNA-binding domain-containing protein n=1 Tax=Rosa chinensis TaxID=74649 RepID=A0A2P6RYZ7_ROSCH|nr:hypothetical protein RchiOBHm_Chr2g0146731 [Rosa chinensis]
MEEDDEMHSPVSAGSGSPASPRANGRITVTVAVPSQIPAAAQESPQNNTLTLALPSQVRSSGGREDCWSESATAVLIEAWGREDYGKIPKTDIQCKNRIDTVKKKYKLEKSKMMAGGGPSKWPFFEKLDHLIGATAKGTPGSASGGGSVPPGFLAKNHKIPMGMPVGVRGGGVGHFVPKHQQQLQQLQKANAKKRDPVEWDSDSSREVSPVSADSFPPPVSELKRPRMAGRGANTGLGRGRGGGGGGVGKEIRGRVGGGEKKGGWGNSMRELTQAMLRFGEAYEHAETAKLQQVVEMEKQRMKFAKELELQRMQFFMKTQLEISQLKHGRRNGNASNHHRSNNNNNNSDSN